jgi:sugar O-acyltransferase (sialic acid O-acetyltransferase NeuD family)
MESIAIYGAGGFGRETALMIEQINQAAPAYKLLGFFDDGRSKGELVDGYPVLGGMKELNASSGPVAVAMAVADPEVRCRLVTSIANENVYFPVLAHPHANLGSALNHLGRGTIVTAGCVLTTAVVTGEFVIINLNSTIGHDVKIGSYCSLMPGCHISGEVTLGEQSLIGTGAVILQRLTLGSRCRVGAGSVVNRSVSENKTVVGIPARPLRR